MPKDTMVDLYLREAERNRKKYGERTMVFIEVGSFYEVYDVVGPSESPYLRCCAEELGIIVTARDKTAPEKGYMAGIPSCSEKKYTRRLLRNNYTVVLIKQFGEPPNITRRTARVLSPGCTPSEDINDGGDIETGDSMLCVLLLEVNEDACADAASVVTFDANTGEIVLHSLSTTAVESTAGLEGNDGRVDDHVDDSIFSVLSDALSSTWAACHEVRILLRVEGDPAGNTGSGANNNNASAFRQDLDAFERMHRRAGRLVNVQPLEGADEHLFVQSSQAQHLERYYGGRYSTVHSTIWEAIGLAAVDRALVATLVYTLIFVEAHSPVLVQAPERPLLGMGYERRSAPLRASGTMGTMGAMALSCDDVLTSDNGCTPTLRCFNGVYTKLNMFGGKGADESVFGILRATRTRMGERLLRERLERVATDPGVIQRRYDVVDALRSDATRHREIGELLKGGCNLHRVYRRVSLGTLDTSDLPRLQHTHQRLLRAIALLREDKTLGHLLLSRGAEAGLVRFQRALVETFDMEACRKSSRTSGLMPNIFHAGLHPTLDDKAWIARRLRERVDELGQRLIELVRTQMAAVTTSKKKGRVAAASKFTLTLQESERDGFWFELTPTRWKLLQPLLHERGNDVLVDGEEDGGDGDGCLPAWRACDVCTLDGSNAKKNVVKLTLSKTTCPALYTAGAVTAGANEYEYHPLAELHAFVARQEAELAHDMDVVYRDTLLHWHRKYANDVWGPAARSIAEIDLAWASAHVANKYNYVRPIIDPLWDSDVESRAMAEDASSSPPDDAPPNAPASFVHAEQLRHPLLERLLAVDKGLAYVPNDVTIDATHGFLLYGINSAGKSSFLKSIAIALLMAQAGLFVAARSFRYYPYTTMFVRMGNHDDLLQHHSSFTREMRETREIIRYATPRSIVIADELCASTEVDSAVSIVACILRMLVARRRSSVAFATHLFDLQEHRYVRDLLKSQLLRNLHLSVDYESSRGAFVFGRALKPGLPTHRRYGALMAAHIVGDPTFGALLKMDEVTTRRGGGSGERDDRAGDGVQKDTLVPLVAKSRYNSKLWLNRCQICGYVRTKKTDMPLDTHHILEQATASSSGHIDHRHKNELSNLTTLCKQCHQQVHAGKIRVDGYVEETRGGVTGGNGGDEVDNTTSARRLMFTHIAAS